MKLFKKTILYYFIVSFPLLIIAGLFSYYLIKSELKDGTDEALLHEKLQAESLIKSWREPTTWYLSADSLSYIKPIIATKNTTTYSDTIVYNSIENEQLLYRKLTGIYIHPISAYKITICKTTLEEEELMEGLLSAFVLIIIFLVGAFFIANWLITKT